MDHGFGAKLSFNLTLAGFGIGGIGLCEFCNLGDRASGTHVWQVLELANLSLVRFACFETCGLGVLIPAARKLCLATSGTC